MCRNLGLFLAIACFHLCFSKFGVLLISIVVDDWDLSHFTSRRIYWKICENRQQAYYKYAQRFEVSKNDVIVHEDWDNVKIATNENDIALIRLPSPAITTEEDFDQIVMPSCLDLFIIEGSCIQLFVYEVQKEVEFFSENNIDFFEHIFESTFLQNN